MKAVSLRITEADSAILKHLHKQLFIDTSAQKAQV